MNLQFLLNSSIEALSKSCTSGVVLSASSIIMTLCFALEVRDTVEKAYRGYLAEDIFVTRSSKLSELAFESADLQLPATALNLLVKSTGPIGQSATDGIAGNAEVMDVAFSADILIDGNNSEIIEVTPNHHVVIRVNSHQPSEIRPYEEVADEVRETVTRHRAVRLAEQQAKEMVSMLDSGS